MKCCVVSEGTDSRFLVDHRQWRCVRSQLLALQRDLWRRITMQLHILNLFRSRLPHVSRSLGDSGRETPLHIESSRDDQYSVSCHPEKLFRRFLRCIRNLKGGCKVPQKSPMDFRAKNTAVFTLYIGVHEKLFYRCGPEDQIQRSERTELQRSAEQLCS